MEENSNSNLLTAIDCFNSKKFIILWNVEVLPSYIIVGQKYFTLELLFRKEIWPCIHIGHEFSAGDNILFSLLLVICSNLIAHFLTQTFCAWLRVKYVLTVHWGESFMLILEVWGNVWFIIVTCVCWAQKIMECCIVLGGFIVFTLSYPWLPLCLCLVIKMTILSDVLLLGRKRRKEK